MSSYFVRGGVMTLTVFALAAPVGAYIAPVFGPQNLSLSPRANGMGEAGVALVDQYAAYYNPANLALYHIDHTAAISFSPIKQKFVPDFFDDFKMWQVGGSVGLPAVRIADGYRLYTAVGYAYTSFSYNGTIGLAIEDKQKSHNFTAAFALSGALNVAAGVTYKYLTASFLEYGYERLPDSVTSHGNSYDFGFSVQQPMRLRMVGIAADSTELLLTPTVAASWSNYGPDWAFYGSSFELPQPRTRRLGAALALSRNSPDRKWYHLLVSFESEKQLESTDDPTQKIGVELALFEAVAARIGSANAPRERWTTYGFGAHTRGLMRLLLPRLYEPCGHNDGWLTNLARRLDIEANYSRVKPKDNLGFSGRWFFGVTASF